MLRVGDGDRDMDRNGDTDKRRVTLSANHAEEI
jgi:hypothetical protein